MSNSVPTRRSPNYLLALFLLLLIVLASLTFLISDNRTQNTLNSSSPQGVVQLFLKAVYAQDSKEAFKYFSPSNVCTTEDLDRVGFPISSTVKLINSTISGESALVRVEVEMEGGGLFDSGFREKHSYRLSKVNNQWRIDGIPWPLYDCGGRLK